jgi:hypothetical protein
MKIINCQTLGELCEFMLDGEPVFLIRAQDSIAITAVNEYLKFSQRDGGRNTMRTETQLERMREWQKANPKKVKLPD